MCKSWWCVAGLLGWVLSVAGCNQGLTRSERCKRICEKRELCDSQTDEGDCVEECRAQNHLSPLYVREWASCVAPDAVSCNLAMDQGSVNDCVSDALLALGPDDIIYRLCNALANKLGACFGEDPYRTRDECLRGDALKLSYAYLQDSRECVDVLCQELVGCFDDLADAHDTNLSVLPSIPAPRTWDSD